jgi:hypothetical protein
MAMRPSSTRARSQAETRHSGPCVFVADVGHHVTGHLVAQGEQGGRVTGAGSRQEVDDHQIPEVDAVEALVLAVVDQVGSRLGPAPLVGPHLFDVVRPVLGHHVSTWQMRKAFGPLATRSCAALNARTWSRTSYRPGSPT